MNAIAHYVNLFIVFRLLILLLHYASKAVTELNEEVGTGVFWFEQLCEFSDMEGTGEELVGVVCLFGFWADGDVVCVEGGQVWLQVLEGAVVSHVGQQWYESRQQSINKHDNHNKTQTIKMERRQIGGVEIGLLLIHRWVLLHFL